MGQQRESSSSSSSRRRRRRRDSSRGQRGRETKSSCWFFAAPIAGQHNNNNKRWATHATHTTPCKPAALATRPPALHPPPHPRLDTQLDGSLAGPHSTSASFERNEIIMRFLRSLFPPRQQGRRGEVERGWVRGCRDCWDCHGWAPNERMKERNDKNS